MVTKGHYIMLIILLTLVVTGCDPRGKMLSSTEVSIKVIDKHEDSTVDFEDTATKAKVTIPVSYNIYGALDINDVIQADKSEYTKDNETKYYYKIKLTKYNEATESELTDSKNKVSNTVPVTITGKDTENRIVGKVSKTYFYVYYRYEDDKYTTQESVHKLVYDSASLGMTVNALKTDYTLQDGRLVTKYRLLIN